jgi:hypothetical protein
MAAGMVQMTASMVHMTAGMVQMTAVMVQVTKVHSPTLGGCVHGEVDAVGGQRRAKRGCGAPV